MRIFLATVILASLSVTAFGLFASTIAEKDHADHVIIGDATGSPLTPADHDGMNLAI